MSTVRTVLSLNVRLTVRLVTHVLCLDNEKSLRVCYMNPKYSNIFGIIDYFIVNYCAMKSSALRLMTSG